MNTTWNTPQNTKWYHATTVTDWHSAVQQAGVLIHAGTRLAAVDRASRITRHGRRITVKHDIYTLALSPEATLLREVGGDENDHEEFLTELPDGVNGYLYRNNYEDVDSLSLLVDPKFLVITKVGVLLPTV